MQIRTLSAHDLDQLFPQLVALLTGLVDAGASIGFHAPMSRADAAEFWHGIQSELREGDRMVLAAFDDTGALVGTGQLHLESRANGRHRGELQKLLVAPSAQRRGVGRALVLALEHVARSTGRTLLVLDTREGDPAARLYASLGWTLVGRVPRYVGESDGTYSATMIFCRELDAA